MRRSRRRCLQALAAAPWLASCALLPQRTPPPLPREFRGAWVASVAHIDWPSRAGLTSAQQRQEMHTLLQRAQAIGLNALVLQVRPAADALYPSALEPWSEYLTGASGQPPDEPWDPLAEWVEGAHRLGLELHAWFNPFRARHSRAQSPPAATHVANAEPQIVRRYGDQLWLDPAEPRAVERTLAVVRDVLTRYDVDGVHIDDYFYPYPVRDAQGVELPFPDDAPWQRYLEGGGSGSRADWRRAQVDAFVERLYAQVHALKPWVRVGISPFGLPRPDQRPAGIEGFSQYDQLYADVERWLHEGWLDYLAPQLYWPIAQSAQAFAVLQDAWHAANTARRHVWPGLFTSRLGAASQAYDAAEVLAQVALTRHAGAVDDGHLHFSMAALLQDREGIATHLRASPYAQPALTPATPWLAEPAPQPPVFAWAAAARRLTLPAGPEPRVRQRVLWTRQGGRWHWQALLPPPSAPATSPEGPQSPLIPELPQSAANAALSLVLPAEIETAWLVAIGRSGLESAPQRVF